MPGAPGPTKARGGFVPGMGRGGKRGHGRKKHKRGSRY